MCIQELTLPLGWGKKQKKEGANIGK